MTETDMIILIVIVVIVVIAIIIILLANQNTKNGVVVYEARETAPPRNKPDDFPREDNRPIGDSLQPASLSFCPSCGRRLHGAMFVCPYCKKRL